MGPEEIRAFQAYDSWQQAVALRKRDDLGKQLGRQVPDLESFRTVVLHVFKACEGRPVPTVIEGDSQVADTSRYRPSAGHFWRL